MSRTTSLINLGVAILAMAGVLGIIALLTGGSYFMITDQSTTVATPIPALEVTVAATGSSSTATPEPTAVPETSPSPLPVEPTDSATETETATPTEDVMPTAQPAGDQPSPADECPPATAESQRLYNPQHGYCLLYPAEYKVEKPTAEETILVIGGLLNPSDPRVSINVRPADGRSTSEIADQKVAEVGAVASIERSPITLAGETAVRLNGLPGQDTYRQLIAVHEGQAFTLTFAPLNTEASAGLEVLYTQIVDTFTFITPTVGDFEECLQATEQTQLLRHDDHRYCLLLPAEYQSEQPSDNETVIYVDSLLNSGRPRLFTEVTEAGDKTAAEVADELLADLGPGFEIERSFGLTVGYEVADQFDNVPGQDISRLVLVVHDGRLYKLTFTPASEDAGEVYEEMEALYDLVVKSFRFLP